MAIKGSDRRTLQADVTAAFPIIRETQIKAELVLGKEKLNIMKLYAYRGIQ